MNDEVKKLYSALLGKGYSTSDLGDEETFRAKMSDKNSRKELYDWVSSKGNFRLGDYESYENRLTSSMQQPEQPAAAPTVPEVETPATPTGETPLTEQDKIRFSAGIEQMKRRTQQSMDDFNERMATMREYHENAPLGGGQTAEGRMMFNPQSGKFEKTYITPLGNRYTSKGLADMESFRYRQAADMSVNGQLRRARLKLAELKSEKEAARSRASEKAQEFNKTKLTGLGQLLVGADIYRGQVQSDPETNAYDVAIHETEELIARLEREQQRENGNESGYWRGLGSISLSDFDFGFGELNRNLTRMHADKYMGENATDGEREAYNEMMGAQYLREEAEQAYPDNWWYEMGVQTKNMAPFALDFLVFRGTTSLPSVFTKGGTRVATKVIGKEVVEEMAEQGFKTYVRNNGVRGFGQYAGNWTIKALGTMGDDLLIRAPLMTNTVQVGKTTSDIIDRKLGNVVVNEDGTYDFSNDETWGSAIWQGEANAIIENYSEMFGAHLDPVVTFGNMSKLANVVGAKRLGAVLSKADAGALSGIMGQTHQLFNKMGVSDYFGEVTEEYYGQMWRTMLNLDDAYQQNPDGTRTNLLATGKFHGDIWGGMALSMGLMGAGKHTLTAANYASMKHGVNKADSHATELLGKEVWEEMRATIDLTTNDDMGAMAEAIINDKDFTPDERAAVLTYMERTMMMRGFNLATFAQSRGEQDSDVQAMNESYIDGYNMESSQEMNDVKNMLDYQRQRVSAIVDEDMLAFMDSNPMNAIAEVRANGVWNDEARATILDYLNAKQVYDGMLQRVRDDIDGRIDQSNAMVEARVNRSTGMIQGATMKVDDRRVYVVSGNLVPFADGSGIDHNASDESIIVRDAQTGALEQVSPDAVLNIDKALDPYIEKETAAEAIRQQYAQEAANRIDGVVTFNPGDTYTITGDDRQIQVQVVANEQGIVDNGDGTVNVSDGTNVFPLAKETIQQQVDEANLARLAQFEQARAEENAQVIQAEQEANRPQYSLNDVVSLTDENGTTVRGSITADADADGRFEVYTESPINGKRVNLFTRDELDNMLLEHNGVAFERPTVGNNGAENIPENGNNAPQNIPAMQRIPKDEQGNPIYEQADSDTAWDAIVEQTEGDEAMAQTVADAMVSDKEAALKKLEKGKSKGGATPAEKIAAEKERKAAIDTAKQELAIWQKIAGTANRRKMEVEAERRRVAEEAAALRKAEEEKMRAEREEAERIEREALNGVPDMVDDTPQDARARGYRRVSGHKIDRQEPVVGLQGKEITVKFSDSTLPTGRVAVIEAEQLQPSHVQGVRNPLHFIDEAQPKERNDEASVLSARKIAGNIRPEEITSSVTAYTGAPTVNARGEAIQGNNRSDALRLMWESYQEQAAKYKQYLMDHAEEFGLNAEDIAGMQHPVLVNMLDVEDADAITLGQFVAQDTESGGVERIKPKNALQRMGADMRSFANLLLKSADEETSFAGLVDNNGVDVLKWMSQKGYITPTQYRSAFDSKGNLSAEAKNDLRGIMYQSIFKGGSTRLEEMFNAMPAKAQKAILATAFRDYDSPSAERMIEEIQNSIRAYYALSQSADFVNAKTFKDARLAVEGWKIQYQIDDATGESYLPAENFSNFALLLATMYKGENQNIIQGTFNKLYDLIQGTQEENLFEQPDNTPRTLAQAIYETLNITYNGQQRSNVLVGDSSASQRGQQGSTGNAATGERIESGERTADSAGSIEAESRTGGEAVHQPQSERKGLEQTLDGEREADSTGMADDATREVLGASNRGDLRVFEEGLDAERRRNTDDSERTRRTAESERLVNIAKQHGMYIPAEVTKTLTGKVPKRTGESVVYIDKEAGKVTKVKDPYAKSAMKSGVQPEDAAFEHLVHNLLFPETEYTFEGISESMGDVRIVLSQKYIPTYGQPTKEQIAEALAARGLFPEDNYSFGNELVSVTDVEGDNVLLGEDGTVYFIDPIIRFKKPLREIIKALGGTEQQAPTIGEQVQAAEAPVKAETPTISQDSEQVSDQDNAPYTIAPAQYTTKKGKVLDMHLVKFAGTLTKEQQRAAKELAKAEKGWYDREQGGFMMRSEESAKQLADTILGNEEAVSEAQPVSMTDIQALNNGDVLFTEPQQVEQTDSEEKSPVWQYSIHVDKETGRTTLRRDDVSGVYPIGDARWQHTAASPEEMLDILRNPLNGMQDVLEAVGVTLENKIKTRELDRKSKEQAPTAETNPIGNRLVTDERYAELRERMRKKLGGQMNIGIDPEILAIGTEMAVYHLEKGARKFTEFAKAMVADLGDVIRPYLKAFYNGARNLPEVESSDIATDMTSYDEVQTFDIANFDKTGIDALATAETVTREAEVAQEVEVAQLRIKKTRSAKNKSVNSQQEQLNLFDNGTEGENTRTGNSGTELRPEELSDTQQVGSGTSVQDSASNSKGKRRNIRVGGSELGNRPKYDVNKSYTNEEIGEIVSSVTDIVDGKVVITGEVTDDIKAICRQYKSGGVAKKGRGILDEYYTDGKIVDAVRMLIAPYFNANKPVRVLEPSVGVGNFIEAARELQTSDVVAFEINDTTARIAKVLYPNVDVNLRSFETEFIDDEGKKKPLPQKYNLVIGNPPYGSHRGLYKGLGEESKIARYEDYFVKRSLDVLEDGGVLAMVLPSSWIDRHTTFGGYTIEAAYRLPSGAFEATQVGTDIVVLKKDSSIPVSEHTPYFELHSDRILGEVKERKGRYGKMEEYVQGDIDVAIDAIEREHAKQIAEQLDIEATNDNLNDIQTAIEETGSADKAKTIVESEKKVTADKKPAPKASGKQGKYKVELNRGAETLPTSSQFTHEFSEGEVEAFEDTDYNGTINNPTKHRKYANFIGGKAVHDFYYAEGDIYSKLSQLEIDKPEIVEKYGIEQYEKQKRLLESVLPKRKDLDEITISPNTTFVKNLNVSSNGEAKSLKELFIDFCRKLPYGSFGDSSTWEVIGYVNNEQVHGTDKQRNQLIRERRKRVANDLFVKFLNDELSDEAKKQVVLAFNREYNSVYRPDYSRVPMFSTINKDFKGKPLKLTSVQLAGIGRMTVKGVGVLAHEVGFGKTLSGILAMHEAMTRGFAKKPLIVVPNDNILKQWVETIKEVLPSATVNMLGNLGTSYDLTDFEVNDGEFTIVTYEGLKAMSFSDDTYNQLADRFSYITEDLKKHQSERDIQKEIEKHNELKGKMRRGAKTSYGFEEFGFDWLTFDEVHNANHIVSKVRLDKSVASDFRSQSQRTSDLGLKTWLAAQYIQDLNNGRNVLLLSATPFTNKPLEYYSILSLVGNDMLRRKGFFNVDQFFATFMEADNDLEIGANGRPVQKTNVRRFRNNGLFQQLLSEFIDIKGEEDNPELVRPERSNKEYKIAQNDLTAEAMGMAQELLSDNDTVLQGIGHARAAAFSPYATSLLGAQPKNHREFVKNSPKIEATIKMIEQNKKDRPDAGQIIYSEVGVEYFPLIRDYLVKESGFKPNEVRIITGATSNNERVNIQSSFNDGEVKVVIGSPAIKEGLNLQGNTTDMYILSLPWNFTQLRQIEGRGWRQGNKWKNIRINYMLTNDSVDVFMLQRLQLKQGLYNEAMKSGAESLDVSDIDTSELKTALITDPAVRAEIVTVQEKAKLQQEKTQIEADLSFVMRKYEGYNKLIEKLNSQKTLIKQYKSWIKEDNDYWASRVKHEENILWRIENDIEQEKNNLLKKGVNVDDIVRQTEQSQEAIKGIQERIDNLHEYQDELTEKFRKEREAIETEQGDLLAAYLKERKAENKSGFYMIRPTQSEQQQEDDDTLYRSDDAIKNRIEALFNQAISGEFKGKPISIGRLTDEGKAYLEQISGVVFKEYVDFVLNPSDLMHIYKDHFGNNEKDKGQNIPLDIEDIRSLVDVISSPDKVVFFKEGEGSNRNMFYFFKEAEDGTYNLMEIYSDRKGNLTAKTFYKTRKDATQRVMDIEKSLLPTSETYSGAILSDAKIPQMFESASVEDDFSARDGDGAYTDDEVSFENDPISKVLGKPRFTRKQRREFAERERQRMVARVENLAKKLNLDNVEIVTDASTLEGKKQRAKGFYTKSTGKITIVIPNHSSTFDVEQTLLHEAVAHYGLRQLFGEHFDTFLDNVFNNADESIRKRISELAIKKYKFDFRKATEEYLAMLAENTEFENTNASWWRQIKDFFLNMLHKIGFEDFGGVTLTDNELRYILWRSYENLAEPGKYRSILGEAADVAKQYELGVGNYAVTNPNTPHAAESDDELYRDGTTLREEYDRKVRVPNKSGSVKWNENLPYRMKESYQDSMAALKTLQDLISEETGNQIQSHENAYMAENRMSSENKAQAEIYERDFYNPLRKAVQALIKAGSSYEDLKSYIIAKHGLERNEYMRTQAEQNGEDSDRDFAGLTALTGMDNVADAEAEAQRIVDDYEQAHDTADLWEKINAATKETLRKSYDSGLMDKATYEKVRDMYEYYVPLRGWDCEVASSEYEYLTSNKLMLPPALKVAKGRTSLADDPLATIGFMAESSIVQGNRNKMKQKFLNFILNNETDLVSVSEQWYVLDNATGDWEARNPIIPENATGDEVAAIVEQFEQKMEALGDKATKKRDGLKLSMNITKREGQEHVVRVKRNGKEYCLYINGSPRAAQAINGLTNPDVNDGSLYRAAKAVKHWMASMFTSKNPAFIATNLSRDVIWAGTAVAIKENAAYTARYTKNVSECLLKAQLPRLLVKFKNGTLDMNNELERYFDEFIRNGGETGFTQLNTVEDYKRNIKRFVKEAQGKGSITQKAWNGLWNSVEFLNRSAEDTTRFMVYMTSRQMGRDMARSIYDAKEITVNFNKKGSGGLGASVMNFSYIFFNATIQSLANFGKLMAKHPAKTTIALTLFSSAGFLVPMLNLAIQAMLGGDDDDENSYWDLPEWVRRNNIVLYVPWSENGYITIPLPHEMRPFYGMGEIAYSCLMDKENVEDGLQKSLAGFSALLPIDLTGNGGNVAVNLTPTIGQPFAQIVANTDYFGKPIYKKHEWNERYPEWTKAYKGTAPWLVDGTRWLNEITGGDNVKSGGRYLNPALIEHLFESYLGGVGKTINKSQKTLEMLWNEDLREWRNVPVISSFYQTAEERTAGSQINREYFNAVDEMKDAQHLFSGYKREIRMGNIEYAEKVNELINSEVFKRYALVKGYDKAIKKASDALKVIEDPTKREDVETMIMNLKVEMLEKLEDLEERK